MGVIAMSATPTEDSQSRKEVISNACHWHAFPPSFRTLWELTQIRPKQRLLELIAKGEINSAMTREEAVALRPVDVRVCAAAPLGAVAAPNASTATANAEIAGV